MKIGIINATINAVEPLQNELKKLDPRIEVINFVNENLLYEVNKKGRVEKIDLRNFMKVLFQCISANVDGIIIGCSVFCAYADFMRPFSDVPIVAVDEPMLKSALERGSKIGIIATTGSAAPIAEAQLYSLAEKVGKKIDVKTAITTEAMTELKRGNLARHNQLVLIQGENLVKDNCDVIVLAQVTMAIAEDTLSILPVPILTSPKLGAKTILELVKQSMNSSNNP